MKVLITRPRAQSTAFATALVEAGFEPVCFPVIEIRPVEDLTALDRALAGLEDYDWVIFTSANAVEVFFSRPSSPVGKKALGEATRVAAIGPKTAAALQGHGVMPDFVPGESVAEAILAGLGELRDCRVLLPRSEIARKALREAIHLAGGTTHEITLYHTLPAEPDPVGLSALRSGVGWITFTSPSTVQNFCAVALACGLDPLALPAMPRIACIGPITAQAARAEGLSVALTAEESTAEGLAAALAQMTWS